MAINSDYATGIPALLRWLVDKGYLPEGFRKPSKHMDVLRELHGWIDACLRQAFGKQTLLALDFQGGYSWDNI